LPILVTFDLSRPEPGELNRIRSAFEQLGNRLVAPIALLSGLRTGMIPDTLRRRSHPEDSTPFP
jgi:hypothetical protein